MSQVSSTTPAATPAALPADAPVAGSDPAGTLAAIGDSDLIHQALKFVSRERYAVLGVLVGLLILFGGTHWGCQSTTKSPFSGEMVTRDQLAVESNTYAAKTTDEVNAYLASKKQDLTAKTDGVKAAVADLDTKDAVRAQILGFVNTLTSLGTKAAATMDPTGGALLGAVMTAVSAGFGANMLRKNAIINKLTDPPATT